MRMRVLATALWALFAARAAWAAPHPLAPLTAAEIRDAVRIFRASGHAPATARFHFISLQEPPKDAGPPPRRRARARPSRSSTTAPPTSTGEAVADLAAGKLASWKDIPGAQPPHRRRRFRHGRPPRPRRSPLVRTPCAPAAYETPPRSSRSPGPPAISDCRARTARASCA